MDSDTLTKERRYQLIKNTLIILKSLRINNNPMSKRLSPKPVELSKMKILWIMSNYFYTLIELIRQELQKMMNKAETKMNRKRQGLEFVKNWVLSSFANAAQVIPLPWLNRQVLVLHYFLCLQRRWQCSFSCCFSLISQYSCFSLQVWNMRIKVKDALWTTLPYFHWEMLVLLDILVENRILLVLRQVRKTA